MKHRSHHMPSRRQSEAAPSAPCAQPMDSAQPVKAAPPGQDGHTSASTQTGQPTKQKPQSAHAQRQANHTKRFARVGQSGGPDASDAGAAAASTSASPARAPARYDKGGMHWLHGAGELKSLLLIVAAALVMAVNLRSFVRAGGLFPGGFTGLTLLIMQIADAYLGLTLPYALINFVLNAIPAVIGWRMVGKRFTLYSCLMIVLTGILTDILPEIRITSDMLLVSVFGGLISGFAVSLCLAAHASSGGTDFIAVALMDRFDVDAFTYILFADAVMLSIAGALFGWDKALYSIIFQFAATQIVRSFHVRYKKTTLFIISDHAQQIYNQIKDYTRHGATLFYGTGLYKGDSRTMLYSVISADQVRGIRQKVREIDSHAFINVIRTDQIAGQFYRPKRR